MTIKLIAEKMDIEAVIIVSNDTTFPSELNKFPVRFESGTMFNHVIGDIMDGR